MRLNKSGAVRFFAMLIFATAAFVVLALEVSPNAQFLITAIRAEGTNVVLTAAVPAGLQQVILEMRPSLDAKWEEMGLLDIPQGGGTVAFTLPKPGGMQFFRLKATPQADASTVAILSPESRYVTVAPLGAATVNYVGTNKHPAAPLDAVFHFKGAIDGSDKITITRAGALWEHVNWSWPQDAVEVNGAKWNPQEKNYLTTAGEEKFLPAAFALDTADLEVIQGRGVVALERTDNALVVYMDDFQNGADDYEFNVHFHPPVPKPAAAASTAATLKITAEIDGSDCLIITATEATLRHEGRLLPARVMLNDVAWLPGQDEVMRNEGTNTFLPQGIDFSTARIVNRKGRDLATMWAEKDAVKVRFADNPNGSDTYELEIAFGK
jgi:hypothetical protein